MNRVVRWLTVFGVLSTGVALLQDRFFLGAALLCFGAADLMDTIKPLQPGNTARPFAFVFVGFGITLLLGQAWIVFAR